MIRGTERDFRGRIVVKTNLGDFIPNSGYAIMKFLKYRVNMESIHFFTGSESIFLREVLGELGKLPIGKLGKCLQFEVARNSGKPLNFEEQAVFGLNQLPNPHLPNYL